MKKIIVGLAAAVLVLSAAMYVLNLESDGDPDAVNGNFIVDGTGYETFEGAISAAKSLDTDEKKVTFNANNLKFTQNATGTDDYGNIKGYDVSGLIIDLNKNTVIVEKEGLTLGGTDFIVCNGTINTSDGADYAIFTKYYIADEPNLSDNVTLRDLTLNAGVNLWNTLNVVIEGLSFTGKNYYSVWCDCYASVEIKDGIYSTSQGKSVLGGSKDPDGTLSEIVVTGGIFRVGQGQVLSLSKIDSSHPVEPEISGGFFYRVGENSDSELENEIQNYLVEGYQIVVATHGGNTGYEVVSANVVAYVIISGETKYYSSLSQAVSDAPYGATINVLKSVGCVENNKDLTFQGASLTHTYVIDEAVSSTCTSEGLTEGSHCSICGDVQVAQQKVPMTDHSWDTGTVTKKATCNTEGSKTFKCTKCGETKTEAIAATGNHVWNSGTITKTPTCSDEGVKTFTCNNCGSTKTEAIPATGNHAWDSGTVINEPTTTESGTTQYTCSVCGKTKTATIEPKKVEVVVEDKVTTTIETQTTMEKSSDGTETVTEAKTVSKEENGRVVEKVETTTSKTESGNTTTVSETTVTEKAGQATEKVETSTSTTTENKTTIVSKTETVEKGDQKTETVEVTIKSDEKPVETSVSISDGSTSGIKTAITVGETEDINELITSAVDQVNMATEAISEKVSDISKDIAVDTHEVTLSPSSLSAIASSGASLTITGNAGSIGIDSNVASTMTSREEDVTISIMEKTEGLTDEQKAKAGENKVIELSARSETEDIHELGGTAKVMIDMTGMDFKSPAVYWLKDDGTSEKVHAEFGEGYAAIELSHFSLYYIAETASSDTTPSFIIIPDTSQDDFPGYIPTPSTDTTGSGSEDTAKIAVLVGAIVVLLVAMVALTHKSR